jgi:hypothetical protein
VAAVLFLAAMIAAPAARAGDAVAIGYNADGIWTSVMYYCSGTPEGGADYKDEAGAREAAVADLIKRAGEGVVKTKILAASDRTGHVAYARARSRAGEDLHAVGYGPSKEAAQADAAAQLQRAGGIGKPKIIYNYFSHGSAPAAARRPAKAR